ncbi:head-tail joining protein [Methylibium sp.]|uniref:head-tail joining protein n=1 Tax=Methylibium sp. TaxID=2067992 RepID=UPI003D101F97
MAFDEDLDAFLAEFGVPCTFGGTPFLALLDQPDQLMDLQRVQAHSRQYELTFRTDAAALVRDMAGTVERPKGVFTAYTVREAPRQVDDGAFSKVLISKV